MRIAGFHILVRSSGSMDDDGRLTGQQNCTVVLFNFDGKIFFCEVFFFLFNFFYLCGIVSSATNNLGMEGLVGRRREKKLNKMKNVFDKVSAGRPVYARAAIETTGGAREPAKRRKFGYSTRS